MQSFLSGPARREEYSRTPSPGLVMQASSQEHSPIPGASLSSHSSPGSSSEHMHHMSEIPDPFRVSSASGGFPTATTSMETSHSQWGGIFPTSENSGGNVPRVVSTLSEATNQASAMQVSSSVSVSVSKPSSPRSGKPAATSRRKNAKANRGGGGGDAGAAPTNNRRQKRLERNRESARLSRRRRKQYLEVLEEKVTQLGQEMDQGRREHVTEAVPTIVHKRKQLLEGPVLPSIESLALLETGLSRTSNELMISTTFQSQQLKSFSLPPSTKFMMWLTLQTDTYYRGGRAASERLSAARIGERILHNGTDRGTPEQNMWPLFCNEIGLSYDQEEKVRTFQRALLLSQDSWLDRHTAFASRKVVQSAHNATQALSLRLGQKERSTLGVLTKEQRIKFMAWSSRNKARVAQSLEEKIPSVPPTDEKYKTFPEQHVSANLYILNQRLRKVLQHIPPAAPLVTGDALKKLSRRPSFESLGCCMNAEDRLSREDSFASEGSLKRSASDLSMAEGEERPHVPSISPTEAQDSAAPFVEKTLGFLKDIMPLPPTPVPSTMSGWGERNTNVVIPEPAPVSSAWMQVPNAEQSSAFEPNPVAVHRHPGHPVATNHARKSSFLPPHMNVVPEEMWPGGDAADDFLMALTEEDWAIGEGIDMEMGP